MDSLLLTDESTISRFHCSKKTKDQVPEILDDIDKPKTKKLDPDVDYATFDLREDIVCLNPDAATTHRPHATPDWIGSRMFHFITAWFGNLS